MPNIRLVLLVSLLALNAAEPCLRGIKLRPQVMMPGPGQRSDITLEIRIPPHAHHRRLDIYWDGGEAGSGSTSRTLDGDNEAALHTLRLRDQPHAGWVFIVEVIGENAEVVGRGRAEVRIPEGPDE